MRNSRKGILLIVCVSVFLIFPGLSQAKKVKLRVTVEKTNIMLKPDSGSKVISEIPLGAILDSEEQIGEWFKVSLPPDEKGFVVTGYIHSSTIEIIEEEQEEKEPEEKTPVLLSTLSPPGPSRGISFGLRLFGGMNYLAPGDVNEAIEEGLSSAYTDMAKLAGISVEGETKPINLGYDFGGDIIVNFTPRVGIGIGAGYIKGKKTSEIGFSNGGELTLTNKPEMSAVPIRLGVFYTLPMNEMINVSFNAGGGLYLAKYSYNFRLEEETGGEWTEYNDEASANGIGFHGGIGLEFNFSPNIAFVLEGRGRYAKIGGFEGTNKFEDSGGYSREEEGTLYYWKESMAPLGKYTFLFCQKDEPSYATASDVREGKVDFSGFTLSAGIKIKF